MTHKEALARLKELGACEDALAWFETQPDPETAWANCDRGDWMLWLAGVFAGKPGSESRSKLTAAARECADIVADLAAEGIRHSVEACYARAASRAAAVLEAAPLTRVGMARNASNAAYFTACAADGESVRLVESPTIKLCADIVRKHYPTCPGTQEVQS